MADTLDEAIEKKFGNKNDKFQTNKDSHIKKVIAVVSGKGGVGKSTVTSLLALELKRQGYKVGIMDSDITGPSIPKAFGLNSGVEGNQDGTLIFPAVTKEGIKIISINLFLEDPETPVLWRGPMLGSAIKQFYSDVLWEDLDYLLIDMPPGTGDVSMTVFQSIVPDGIVIVSTPQDLVKMIVGKAVKMAQSLNVKVLGLVENMSYMVCPNCEEILFPFGPSKLDEVSEHFNITPLVSLPINPSINELADMGSIESADTSNLSECVNLITSNL